MPSIFNTSVSGLLAFQSALATTSHNISNATREGYSRQRVEFVTQTPEVQGSNFVGTGAKVESISRLFSEARADVLRIATSEHSKLEFIESMTSRLDDLLFDENAGLAPAMSGFFENLQIVSNDPTSIPSRQVAYNQAEALSARLGFFDDRLTDLETDFNSLLEFEITEVNQIAASVSILNDRIVAASSRAGGNPPNDLMDQRDQLITDLSEKVEVSTVYQNNGMVNIFVGTGQALVVGTTVNNLSITRNLFDDARREVSVAVSGATTEITGAVTGGTIGGLLEFRDQVLKPTINEMGRIATVFADQFNKLQNEGIDLNGDQGADVFNVGTITSYQHQNNAGTLAVNGTYTEITDTSMLTGSDYRIDYDGTDYTLTRLSDGTVVDTEPAATFEQLAGDGLMIVLDNARTGGVAGDRFLIRPTQLGARQFDVAIQNGRQFAAAAPIRTEAGTSNVGNGIIGLNGVTDPTAPSLQTPLRMVFNDPPTTYNILNNNTLAVVEANVTYTAGEQMPFANPDSIVTMSGFTNFATGDVVTVDVAGTTVTATVPAVPANFPATLSAAITAAGIAGVTSAEAGGVVSITAANTATLTVANLTNTNAGGSTDDSTYVTMGVGAFTTGAISTGSSLNRLREETTDSYVGTGGDPGYRFSISGTPQAGDIFRVLDNTGGIGDNTNALQMVALETTPVVGATSTSPAIATVGQSYSELVSDLGSITQRTTINLSAQQALLNSAKSDVESLSGVNLDEEAADLVKYQQAYQATAQVVSIAQSLFATMLGVFR